MVGQHSELDAAEVELILKQDMISCAPHARHRSRHLNQAY